MGSPLDDVIVEGALPDGTPGKLEVQVKRTLDFTASDSAWRDTVAQIAASASRLGADPPGHERAIAIGRMSTAIERSYQQVLSWARDHEDAQAFATRIATKGMANDAMRGFVEVFRANLQSAAYAHDDDTVWRLLRRLQILHFDFEASGSRDLESHRARLASLLMPAERSKAGSLWASLVEIALQVDASGGGLTRAQLVERLRAYDFALGAPPALAETRERLAELSCGVLGDIRDRLGASRLLRADLSSRLDKALDASRYVEISGSGGVGKSAAAKALVDRVRAGGEVLCLNEVRTPGQGWPAFRERIASPVGLLTLLEALAAGGGALLFIDGVDRYLDEGKRATLRDVLSAASASGFRIVATARSDFTGEARFWWDQALGHLSRETVEVPALSDAEARALATENAALASLLRAGHPASALTRNLFHLSRLLASPRRDGGDPDSEAAMVSLWWSRGGGVSEAGRNQRLRLLRRAAAESITGPSEIRLEPADDAAVGQLISAETLQEIIPGETAGFVHDVLRDWTTACWLHEDGNRVECLPLAEVATVLHVRGVELTARMWIEAGEVEQWGALLNAVSRPQAHGSWRRAVLLALTRSEKAGQCLRAATGLLLANDAELLLDLLRLARTVDAKPLSELLALVGRPPQELAADLMTPSGPGWYALLEWLFAHEEELPARALSEVIEFFIGAMAFWGLFPEVAVPMTAFAFRALWRLEGRDTRSPLAHEVDYRMEGRLCTDVRQFFLATCHHTPEFARQYLQALVKGHAEGGRASEAALVFWGTAIRAAPDAYADYVLAVLTNNARRQGADTERYAWHGPFDLREVRYSPASPAQGPFFELLTVAPSEGLRVIEGMMRHLASIAVRSESTTFTVNWPWGPQDFDRPASFIWPRDGSSPVLSSALRALEAWAHQRLDGGEPVSPVLREVLGDGVQPCARLAVAVDVALSHWEMMGDFAPSLLASPELLALDADRFHKDLQGIPAILEGFGEEPDGPVGNTELRARPSRATSLQHQIGHLLFYGPPGMAGEVKGALESQRDRVSALPPIPWGEDEDRPVLRALQTATAMLDRCNWREVQWEGPYGEVVEGLRFHEPSEIAQPIAPRRAEAERRMRVMVHRGNLAAILTGSRAIQSDQRDAAIAWALTADAATADVDDFAAEQARAAVRMAAAVMLRDLEPSADDAAWARAVLQGAMEEAGDEAMRSLNRDISYSPAAIAAAGFAGDIVAGREGASLRPILELASRPEIAVAAALGRQFPDLARKDQRLPSALFILGLTASLYFIPKQIEISGAREHADKLTSDRRQAAHSAVHAWLNGGDEPPFPKLPTAGALRPRRRRRKLGPREDLAPPAPRPEWGLNEHLAAAWLEAVAYRRGSETDELLKRYWPYTRFASGGDAVSDDDLSEGVIDAPKNWNATYFSLLARQLAPLSPEEARNRVRPLVECPDGAFVTFSEALLRAWNGLWVHLDGTREDTFQAVRSDMAQRLSRVQAMEWVRARPRDRIDAFVAGPVCALAAHTQYPTARLYCEAGEKMAALVPAVGLLARSAPQSGYIASLFVNLINGLRSVQLAEEVAATGRAWVTAGHDATFWSTWGIGQPYCQWILSVADAPGGRDALARSAEALTQVLDAAVRFGVSNASRAESVVLEAVRRS